eukprot:TRINITY_DN4756_c0_g1_i1.p1 TRINITY_DN4756_c0_g1~~TRINITY_DN4756_c0_g1_i1.p1  ORF type:complete len:218 (+),score=67.39 TRINITY_DN4756_c0_g1_i1:45-698(+)
MKVAVVCLLFISLAVCQEFEQCFNHFRKIAKGFVNIPIKVTPSNSLEYIARIENSISLIQNLWNVCADFQRWVKNRKDSLADFTIERLNKRREKVNSIVPKLTADVNRESDPERRAEIVYKAVWATNGEIVQISHTLDSLVWEAFFLQTTSQECSWRVAELYDQNYKSEPVRIIDESIANFKYCSSFRRLDDGIKIRNSKLREWATGGQRRPKAPKA